MTVTRTSALSGKVHTMDLPITPEQVAEYTSPNRMRHIQVIFPHLSDGQREFIMSGITEEEWDDVFGDDE